MSNLDAELEEINEIDDNLNTKIELYEEKMETETPPWQQSKREQISTDQFTPSMDNKKYPEADKDEFENFPEAYNNLQCGE